MKKKIMLALSILCIFGMFNAASVVKADNIVHTVVFDPDNGTSYNDWESTQVEDGETITFTPTDPEKEGYVFKGWYHSLDANDKPIYWNFETDVVTENTTLWAGYEKLHTVVFDPDNGTSYNDWESTQVENGKTITFTPTASEKEGYIFKGWYHSLDANDKPIYWNFKTDVVTENTTLWAGYEKLHTVVFDPENGTSYNDWESTQVENGKTITFTPTAPEKEGYIFEGWYHSLDANDKPIYWNFKTDVVTENTTLWAGYSKGYTVTFNPTNGQSQNEWVQQVVKEHSLIENAPTPKNKGYKFVGWSKQENSMDAWNFSSETVEKDTTLYAVWQKDKTPVEPDDQNEGKKPNTLPSTGNNNAFFSMLILFAGLLTSGGYLFTRKNME